MMEQLRNTQESVVKHFPIDQSQVSRYLKNKIETMKDTADNYWKKLLRDQKGQSDLSSSNRRRVYQACASHYYKILTELQNLHVH